MCPNQLLLLLLASSIFKNRQGPGLMVGCQQTGSWPYGWLSTDRALALWLVVNRQGPGLMVGCQQTGVLALWLVVNRQGFWHYGLWLVVNIQGPWPYGWLSTDRPHGWLSTDRGSGLMAYGWLSTDKPTAGLLGPKNADPGGAKIKFWYPLQNCHTVTPTQLQVLA